MQLLFTANNLHDSEGFGINIDEAPEKASLFLPSEIVSKKVEGGCPDGLMKIEALLRNAQATDALQHIKNRLCTYQNLVHYKISQVSGPGVASNTRTRNLLKRFKTIILRSTERYRAARAALAVLDPNGDWQARLKPL